MARRYSQVLKKTTTFKTMPNAPKEKPVEQTPPKVEKPSSIKWDHEEDNCGINPDENPCGDASEY